MHLAGQPHQEICQKGKPHRVREGSLEEVSVKPLKVKKVKGEDEGRM
jgi:hypothetical protein